MQGFLDEIDLPNEDDEFFDLDRKQGYVDPDSLTPFELSYKYYNRLWAEALAKLDYMLKKETHVSDDETPEIFHARMPLVRRYNK